MLGVKSGKAKEFAKANVELKAIRVEETGIIKESVSFPTFGFIDLLSDEINLPEDEMEDYEDLLSSADVEEKKELREEMVWRSSSLYEQLNDKKYLFVVFKKEEKGGCYYLKGCRFWNMPYHDLNDKMRYVWKNTRDIIREDVRIEWNASRKRYENNFIASTSLDSNGQRVSGHVRPHANRAFYQFADGSAYGNGEVSDSDLLPDGRRMTKQCFWLNRNYIREIISGIVDCSDFTDDECR